MAEQKEQPSIAFTLWVTAEEVAAAIAASYDQNFTAQLIKMLDEQMHDYEFTVAMRDHFIKEVAKCDADAEAAE